MNKQVLIQEITALFGSSKGARFHSWVERWVDKQLERGVIAGDDWVFLEQIGLDRFLAAARVAIDGVETTTSDFFSWAWMLPVKDKSRNALAAMVEYRKAFFEYHLAAMGVTVTQYGAIREDDIICQTGSFEHICIDKNAGASGPVQALFINVVNTSGVKGSLVISMNELEHIRAGQVEFKYGGLDPLKNLEWEEFYECCLLRRLITSSIFDSLRNDKNEKYKPLMYAINHHNSLYTAGMRGKPDEDEYHRDGGVRFKTQRIFSDMPAIAPESHKNVDADKVSDNVVPMERPVKSQSEGNQLVKPVYADEVASSSGVGSTFAAPVESHSIYIDSQDGVSVFDAACEQPLVFNSSSIF